MQGCRFPGFNKEKQEIWGDQIQADCQSYNNAIHALVQRVLGEMRSR